MTAFEKALAQIGDAFRPERDEWRSKIATACRLKELVTSHRMTFPQALEKLETRTDFLLEAFELMALDNTALNITYECDTHTMGQYALETWDWLKRMTGDAS